MSFVQIKVNKTAMAPPCTIMIKALLLVWVACMAAGCTVPSKNMVGFQECRLEPQQIDGTWINADGAVALKVMDADKGIVRAILLANEEKPEIFLFKVMKGKSWLYFNLLPQKNQPANKYYWGKVKIDENRIVAWHPSDKAFIRAIEEGKVLGTVEPPLLTDSAKNIMELVESSENPFFEWQEPLFIIRVTK